MKKMFTLFLLSVIIGGDLLAQTGDIFPLIPGRKLRYTGFLRDKTTDSNTAAPIIKSYTIITFEMFKALNPTVGAALTPAGPTHVLIDSLRIITGASTYIDTVNVLPVKRASNTSGDVYLLSNMSSTYQKLGHVSAYPYVWVKLWKEGATAPTTWYALDSAFATPLGGVPVKIQSTMSGPENYVSTTGETHQAYKAEFKATSPTVAARNTYTIWVVPKFGIVRIIIHGDGVANGQDARINGAITNVPLRKEIVASNFELGQNYPNPFNPSTKISFSLPEKSIAKIRVFDALGREINSLVNSTLEAGKYEVPFVASGLSSTMYFYQISAEGLVSGKKFSETKKMILNK